MEVYFFFILIIVFVIIHLYFTKKSGDNFFEKIIQDNTKFNGKFNGIGIVITVTESNVFNVLTILDTLKHYSCNLPVEIVSTKHFKVPNNFPPVSMYDTEFESLLEILGIINSKFEQVIVLNPCVTLLKNPMLLFQDPFYQESGCLIYKKSGKTLNTSHNKFIKKFLPYKNNNPVLRNKCTEIQNNSVIVFNKKNHKKTLKKMEYCVEYYNSLSLNPTELTWFCCELAKENYFISPLIGNVNGKIDCYFDHYGQLFWINSPLIKDDLPIEIEYISFNDNEWTLDDTMKSTVNSILMMYANNRKKTLDF